MNNIKDIEQLIENYILDDRNTALNPFISTRIMAAIEKNNSHGVKQVIQVWKVAIVAFSLVVALLTGIVAGGLYQPKIDTNDVVQINDRNMEHFDFYLEMEKE